MNVVFVKVFDFGAFVDIGIHEDDLPQLFATTYCNSLERLTITRYSELPQLVVGSLGIYCNELIVSVLFCVL
mgnify:CR=1 FL=1